MGQQQTINNDISLYGLIALLLKNWIILSVCGIGFAVAAIAWSLTLPNVYTAETILMPVDGEQKDLSGLSGNLGGLAAMAGVSLGDKGGDNAKLAMELIKSRAFIGKFIEDNDILVPLMAAQGWDMSTDTLDINPEVYDLKNKKWVRQVVAPFKPQPSLQEAHFAFLKILTIEEEPKTKFVTLEVDFYSPHIAAKWARALVDGINQEIRQMDLDESTRSIEYLQKISSEIQVSELRNVFSSLMEEQIKSKMLAAVKKDYVFKIIDPAVAPELKSKPKRGLIAFAAGFFGGIIGIIIILIREGRRNHLLAQKAA